MLEGIRILDFSQYYPGPFATLRLQEWGAEVIKIEPPKGDYSRVFRKINDAGGVVYNACNPGKQSMIANLKDENDLARVRKLVESADVIVEGFRPGVMTRLGLGYDDVSALNPGIVYVSISGYGQTGSLAMKSGHDLNYLALSGILNYMTDTSGRPIVPDVLFMDTASGIVASEAVLCGLVKRSLSEDKKGCYFDISMAESLMFLQSLSLGELSIGNTPRYSLTCANYNVYETKDGRFVTIAAMEPKFWKDFCAAVGREDLLECFEAKAEDGNEQYEKVKACFKERTFDEWMEFFYKEDCCFAPVLGPTEVIDFPLFTDRKMLAKVDGFWHVKTHYMGDIDYPDYKIPMATLGQNMLGL